MCWYTVVEQRKEEGDGLLLKYLSNSCMKEVLVLFTKALCQDKLWQSCTKLETTELNILFNLKISFALFPYKVMDSNNPKYILRNYLAQNAIDEAEKENFLEVRSSYKHDLIRSFTLVVCRFVMFFVGFRIPMIWWMTRMMWTLLSLVSIMLCMTPLLLSKQCHSGFPDLRRPLVC